jgi:hypothetical protein
MEALALGKLLHSAKARDSIRSFYKLSKLVIRNISAQLRSDPSQRCRRTVLLSTGLRGGECQSLSQQKLDIDHRRVAVHYGLVDNGGLVLYDVIGGILDAEIGDRRSAAVYRIEIPEISG